MADTKITGYSALTGSTVATGDTVPLVDVSDTTMAATGTNKKITAADLALAISRLAAAPITLTDGATIALDASQGRTFRVTLGGNRTLSTPTNPADGQTIDIEITQDATGTRTLTLPTGAGGFAFGTDAPSSLYTLSTTGGVTDYLFAKYSSSRSRWHVIGFIRGFSS